LGVKEGNPDDGQHISAHINPTCFYFAKMYEAANSVLASNKFQMGVLGPTPSSLSSLIPLPTFSKPKQQRSLIPTYMTEWRIKGLCYICGESYSLDHSLVHKEL